MVAGTPSEDPSEDPSEELGEDPSEDPSQKPFHPDSVSLRQGLETRQPIRCSGSGPACAEPPYICQGRYVQLLHVLSAEQRSSLRSVAGAAEGLQGVCS